MPQQLRSMRLVLNDRNLSVLLLHAPTINLSSHAFRHRLQECWGFSSALWQALLLWLLWVVSQLGLFEGAAQGAKQIHINLHFVWIFRYSCLWHRDSSWCAWAPQISQCHAWIEAVASGPKWAQPALANQAQNLPKSQKQDRFNIQGWSKSMKAFNSLKEIHEDTFSTSLFCNESLSNVYLLAV